MCNAAINEKIRQQTIASGKMPFELKDIPAMWGSGNIVEYNPEEFSKSLESVETFKAAYPGFQGFLHHMWNSEPIAARSVATDVDKNKKR